MGAILKKLYSIYIYIYILIHVPGTCLCMYIQLLLCITQPEIVQTGPGIALNGPGMVWRRIYWL